MAKYSNNSVKKKQEDITCKKAQDKAIESLKRAIFSFCDSKKMKTRVIPLAIPTGWGKTRIAVQSVFGATYDNQHKTYKPTVILWPQKDDHIENVWCGKNEWKGLDVISPKKLKDCKKIDDFASHSFFSIDNALQLINSNTKKEQSDRTRRKIKHFKKVLSTLIKNTTGPIVYIIDEWHSKKIIEAYEERKKNMNAEQFWRHYLLQEETKHPGKRRKLFVLLLSATPIATTASMDEAPLNEKDADEVNKKIAKSVKSFNELSRVGNQNRKYNLYDIYPNLIDSQVKKLGKYNGVKFPIMAKKETWANEYVSLNMPFNSKKCPYQDEQSAILKKTNNLKQRILKKFLENHSKRKFIVFCHYTEIAEQLQEQLGSKAVFLEACGKSREVNIELFNKAPIEDSFQVLILMDRDSQGISLHESKAWLIHYELSWNPIRIIQRFGRVWRLFLSDPDNENSLELTCPKAFCIPFSYSGEEEQLNRLSRRWKFLSDISKEENDKEENKKNVKDANKPLMNLTPIPYEIALGKRLTPEP